MNLEDVRFTGTIPLFRIFSSFYQLVAINRLRQMAQAIQCNRLRLRDLTEGLYAVKIFFLVLILGKSVLVKVMAIDLIRTLVLRLILLLLTSSSESGGRKVHWNYPSFSHIQ